MANNRAAIRSALANMLSGETAAEANVYPYRETNLWRSELPAILIYTNQEPAIPESLRGARYIRTLELTVEVRVEKGDSESVDDAVDTLLAEIETLVLADSSIGGTVLSTTQTNTEIRVDSDADRDIGVGVLTFECKYVS